MTYRVVFTPRAEHMLEEISDRIIQQKIVETAERLVNDPEKQGKPMLGPLAGFRSLRAVGQRYRIIYKVKNSKVLVIVVGVGIRKDGDKQDVYKRLQKLIHMKLL